MQSTAPRSTTTGWFTSSYSNDGNACVQVRFDDADVLVADSKQRGSGPVIRVSGLEWDAFVAAVLADVPVAPGALRAIPTRGGGRMVMGADGTALEFTAQEWAAFTAGAIDGEFTRAVAVARA